MVSKETEIVFAYSKSDLHWALNYRQKHKDCNIKILTPTFDGREMLRRENIPYDDFFLHPLFQKNFYAENSQQIFAKTKKILAALHPFFCPIKIGSTIIFDALSVSLETELASLLFSYDYLDVLKKHLKAKHFHISKGELLKLGGITPSGFTIASHARHFFLEKDEVEMFSPVKQSQTSIVDFINRGMLHITRILRQSIYAAKNFPYRIKYLLKNHHSATEVLLYSAGPNLYYYQLMLPKLLLKAKTVILTGPQSQFDDYLLFRSKIPFTPLSTLKSKEMKYESERFHSIIDEQFSQALLKAKKEQAQIFSLPPKLSSAVFTILSMVWKLYLRKIISQSLLAEKALERYKPDLTITTHDPGLSSLPFVFKSRAIKKKTLVLLHGWQDMILGADHFSDSIAVWSDYISSWFEQNLHKKASTIYVSGFPALDHLFLDKKAFWQRSQTTVPFPKRPIFGLLLTLYPVTLYPSVRFLEQLFKAAKQSDFQGVFYLRTHSGQDAKESLPIAKKYHQKIKYNPKMSLETFVEHCDCILSWDTTAIFWPMIFGKPLFYTTPLWGYGITPVDKLGGAWMVNAPDQIFTILKKLSREASLLRNLHEDQKRFLKKILGFIDGTASGKTLECILSILKEEP